MRGHPVEDHAQPRLMAAIDEARERRRLAEARRGREESDRLISPRRIERILAHRRQLEMREAHVDDIGDERLGQFVVRRASAVLAAPPRAQVHLVDRDRRAARVGAARARPSRRRRSKRNARIAHDRRRRRPQFRAEAHGIGLQRRATCLRRRGSRTCRAHPRRDRERTSPTRRVSTRLRIACRRPSHALNSPTTDTRRACGAHTAKCTPAHALVLDRMRAEVVVEPRVARPVRAASRPAGPARVRRHTGRRPPIARARCCAQQIAGAARHALEEAGAVARAACTNASRRPVIDAARGRRPDASRSNLVRAGYERVHAPATSRLVHARIRR